MENAKRSPSKFYKPSAQNVVRLYCPVCGKRACDVKKSNIESVIIELKCPNCKRVVEVHTAVNSP